MVGDVVAVGDISGGGDPTGDDTNTEVRAGDNSCTGGDVSTVERVGVAVVTVAVLGATTVLSTVCGAATVDCCGVTTVSVGSWAETLAAVTTMVGGFGIPGVRMVGWRVFVPVRMVTGLVVAAPTLRGRGRFVITV